MPHSIQPDKTSESVAPDVTTIAGISFEHLRSALGLGVSRPRLSWLIETEIANWLQSGYEIESYDVNGTLCEATGRVKSGDSVLVAWPFSALRSHESVAVRVRVWGADGSSSAWSALHLLEAGLLDPADWRARFVAPD